MLTPQRTTLGLSKGWVWYTLSQLCRLTPAERLPARFPSLGLHCFWFRLRSVWQSAQHIVKLNYNVTPHGIRTEAPDHLSYYITEEVGRIPPSPEGEGLLRFFL